MQHKIEARTDYTTINQNPIELLKAIKQHALNYQENRYPMSIIYDSMKTVFNTKQREDENLNQYQQRFKTQRDVMSSHIGGPIILTQLFDGFQQLDWILVDGGVVCSCFNLVLHAVVTMIP